jgi:hypothetical protein
MKKFFLALFVLAAAAVFVAPALATETWDPHLRGINEGLAAGALPPPGVYLIHSSQFAPAYHQYGNLFNASQATGGGGIAPFPSGKINRDLSLFAYVDIPVLVWVPGCKFLGADYGMAIAQPFDYTNLRIKGATAAIAGFTAQNNTGAQWGAFNTILVPYELSWRLPCDFRVKTGLGIALNDPTNSAATATTLGPGIFAVAGNGTYTFEPTLGLSWLHAGWNVSADFHYAFQTKDTGTDYQSGQQLAVDYTVAYTWGKWTIGVGAGQETQTTTDTWKGVNLPDSKANAWTVGPIVGYNFGPLSMEFIYNFGVYINNDVGGDWLVLRMVIPLWK